MTTIRTMLLPAVLFLLSAAGPNRAAADDAIDLTVSNAGAATVSGKNTNNADDSDGVRGIATGTGRNAGVLGKTETTTSDSAGVWGRQGTDLPVDRTNFFAAGVRGESKAKRGILGISEWKATAGWGMGTGQVVGVEGVARSTTANNSAGVLGHAEAADKRVYGVWGTTPSTQIGGAGVLGEGGDAVNITQEGWLTPAGVRGTGKEIGTSGHSNRKGVQGVVYDVTTGRYLASGSLGAKFVVVYGVYTDEDIAAKGMKKFIEPHPTDPSKLIAYVALEGPEAGTYFRGTSQTDGGVAVIPVPDHFRFVTDAQSITVQVTPRDLAVVGVVDRNLNQITVRANPDVAFDYLVQGVRRAYANYDPIQPNGGEFAPGTPSGGVPDSLPEEIRNRLIANGTYNPDGTPNLETARKLGWLERWEQPPGAGAPADRPKDSER